MVGRIRFALERWDSPRHRSQVAQLFSFGNEKINTDFQKIAEPLIRQVFPSTEKIERTEERRGLVHLAWHVQTMGIFMGWEPFGPPWASIGLSSRRPRHIQLPEMALDPVLVSPDMKTEIQVRELLRLIVLGLTSEQGGGAERR